MIAPTVPAQPDPQDEYVPLAGCEGMMRALPIGCALWLTLIAIVILVLGMLR